MGPALWLFVLTVNLAPQTHVPKLASLPHASPTNVTFMSSFSQGHPPLGWVLASPLSLQTLCGLSLTSTHIHSHSPTPQTPSPHLLSLLLFLSSPHLVLQPSTSTCLLGWFSLNLFHILLGSYFWLLCSRCLHYQEYISCQFILWLNTTKDSLFGRFKLQLKRMLILQKKVLSTFCDDFFQRGSELTKITIEGELKKLLFHAVCLLKKTLQTTENAYLILTEDKLHYHPDSWSRMAVIHSKVFQVLF